MSTKQTVSFDDVMTSRLQPSSSCGCSSSAADFAVTCVELALEKNDSSMLLEALRMAYLSLRDVNDSNAQAYLKALNDVMRERNNNEGGDASARLTRDEIQAVVHKINNEASREFKSQYLAVLFLFVLLAFTMIFVVL